MTPRQASIEAGGSPDLIRGLLRGKQRSFRGENAARLAKVLKCSLRWLLTGDGEIDGEDHVSSEDIADEMSHEQKPTNGAHSLANYKGDLPGATPEIDARAGAGQGQVGENEVVTLARGDSYIGHRVISEWVFPPQYLRHELRASPASIMLLEVVGDSMSPTLESGDRVLIDTQHSKPTPDGIYVIDEGDGPMVKRLQMVRRSDPPEIRVISDNTHHEAYTLLLDQVRVIGRVAARLSKA